MRTAALVVACFLAYEVSAQTASRPTADGAGMILRLGADLDGYERFYPLRWSEGLLEQRGAFLKGKLTELNGMDFGGLSQSGKVDWLLLRNETRSGLAEVELQRGQLAEMDSLLAVRKVVVPLEVARWGMEPMDPKFVAGQLAKVPGVVKGLREGLKGADGKLTVTPVVAQRAGRALEEFSRALGRYHEHYAEFDPAYSWWCGRPMEEARKSIDEFARHLKEEVAGIKGKPEDPLIGDPIGREALLAALRDEFVALSPEELIALGDAEFAWCEARMNEAAVEMGFTADAEGRRKALEAVKADSPGPGEQPAYVAAVAREAEAFLAERGLVTVPPFASKTWRIAMLSPREQRTLPFAVYSGQAIGVAYPAASMGHEDKLMSLRGNNRHFTRIVVPHELIPGHHLQGYMAQRERPERRRFSTPFSVEGWALYWEMKLWDLGWGRTPQERVGMLFWRMHRCARITVSLRFHLGQMTPKEMIDFLVERVGHEPMGATSEVRRYIGGDYGPLYQAGYMVGGKQVRALWREVVPGRMSERAFNDAFLQAGPIPIELLRVELTGEVLTREREARWRFE